MNNLPNVSRVEVINHAVSEDNEDYGRAYVYWPDGEFEPKVDIAVFYDLQDDGRTLKVFIEKKTTVAPTNRLQQIQEEARKENAEGLLYIHPLESLTKI